jgi:hypothetical protein
MMALFTDFISKRSDSSDKFVNLIVCAHRVHNRDDSILRRDTAPHTYLGILEHGVNLDSIETFDAKSDLRLINLKALL